jgi:hypothetical protein
MCLVYSLVIDLTAPAALLVGVRCLWVRRDAWGCQFEAAGCVTVAAMITSLALTCPQSVHISACLRAITGVNNLAGLLGHLAYIVALLAVLHTLADRVSVERSDLQHRIGLPLTFIIPLLVGLFATGAPTRQYDNLLSAPTAGALRAYTALLCLAVTYLTYHIWRLLSVLRADARTSAAIHLYTVALLLGCGCAASATLSCVVHDYPAHGSFLLGCASALCYCLAPAHSWRCRKRATPPPLTRGKLSP